MQLFGINQSNVPSLVFYGDLVPVAQVLDDRVEKFGRCYLGTLLDNFRCPLPEIWIDSKQGTFVRGVGGPYCEIRSLGLNDESLPSCTQFLRDDVYLRYLSRFPLDRQFDRAVLNVHRLRSSSEDLYATTNQPHVLSGVTGSIIAVGGRIWEATGKCLNTQVQMPDGTMRFHLKDHKDRMFQLYSSRSEDECAWLSQASSVFDKLGISLDENLSNYQLITPVFWLQGWMMNSAIKRQRRLQGSPIYLFIPPIPLSPPLVSGTTVSVHIWSFDETGQAPISNESCEYLGLPVQLWLQVFQSSYQPSWPKETYQAIHKWQIARGFDPSSTNFARFLGYPVYHAQLDARRFEELDEGWVKV
ncbi:hypothetical protein L218DRAFT_574350 [Marasmius fiardii PR-910]|nr:hypothetical protein L218DRAFT_574350 [Marasmius fiardii PR-910]